ncbi:MAG: hypothetical protein WCN98_15815, partial [Verrucomicrobiaceae bacterium]
LTLYYHTANKLKQSEMYVRNDVFFRTDTFRAFKDMVGERNGARGRTSVHPIFVMTHQPVGALLTDYYRTKLKMKKIEATQLASMSMTSAAGTGTVLFVYATLLAMSIPALRAFLFASILGMSATQMFFSSAPETYVFSSLGLAAVAFFSVRRKTSEVWFQSASVYAVGCLTTNLAPVALWCTARHWNGLPGWRKLILRVTGALTLTIFVLIVLSVVQKWIYPNSAYFFVPSAALNETEWLYWENLTKPLETVRILMQHLWLSNIIAPEPLQEMFMNQRMASIEQGHWATFQPAWPLYLAWAIVLVAAVSSLRFKKSCTLPILAALGCIAFNFFFHSVFGNDRMLYSANWTLFTVMSVAWGVEVFLKRHAIMAMPMTALLAVVLVGEMIHNWRFIDKILAVVQDGG